MSHAARRLRPAVWLGLALIAVATLTGCGKREAKAPKVPAMWHLSDANSDIHLFGTFHLLPAGVKWQDPAMKNAFDNASLLVLEADVADAKPAEIVKLVEQYGVAPADQPLSSLLTPDQQQQLATVCASLKIDPTQLDSFQPWYAAIALTVQYAKSRGLSEQRGVEQTLIQEAKKQGKATAYLETVSDQIGFFANLPQATQVKMLVATLHELQTSDKELADMEKAWVQGDTGAMAKLFDRSVRDVPDLYQALVVERNKRWADEIEKLMAGGGKIFIAVGAGHLVGKDSVVAMLRARGFKVEGP